GTMVGRVNQAGHLAIVNATVRIEDNNIYSTTRHPQTGEEKTTVQTIRTLTAKELVVEDARQADENGTSRLICFFFAGVSPMIEPLHSDSPQVLGFKMSGKLHDADYKTFVPMVDRAIAS